MKTRCQDGPTSGDELEKLIEKGSPLVTLVFSNYCPFCVEFRPIFEKYASCRDLSFHRIDVEKEPQIYDQFEIDVVPTVLFFENGRLSSRLDGIEGVGLSENDLVGFLKKTGLVK